MKWFLMMVLSIPLTAQAGVTYKVECTAKCKKGIKKVYRKSGKEFFKDTFLEAVVFKSGRKTRVWQFEELEKVCSALDFTDKLDSLHVQEEEKGYSQRSKFKRLRPTLAPYVSGHNEPNPLDNCVYVYNSIPSSNSY